MASPTTSYDVIPYLNRSHTSTHPDRLATLATLLGLDPAPLEACRVLELGCANGYNLLPMAGLLPGSRFVGVDLSARQIDDGREAVRELGLANLELRQASILDVDDSYGRFDYILVHGVYSWVPPEVQDRILAICKRNLAERGVAYVSYNTFPGWYSKLRVRDMMLHHVRGIRDPHTRIRQSREFLYQLADLLAPATADGAELNVSAYAATVRAEAELVRRQDDDYIFHEYLEDDNRPLYFHEFMEQAERHGLQYLGDAAKGLVAVESYGPDVVQALKQITGGIVEQEQFLDFLNNGTFRCTLLCHAGQRLNRAVPAARLKPLYVRSDLRPASDTPDLAGPAAETFQSEHERTSLAVSHAVTKAALARLHAAWPRALAFSELLAAACEAVFAGELGQSKVVRAREAEQLGLNLLQAFTHNSDVVSLHSFAPPLLPRDAAADPAARPAAPRWARFEALLREQVTNAYHQPVRLGTLSWNLLPFLDGTRDHAALVDLFVANQALALEQDGQEITDPALRRAAAEAKIVETLIGLGDSALLMECEA